MDRSARLKLAALAAAVAVGHLLLLEWIGRHADLISGLPEMAPVMFTRTLQPTVPPPVVAAAPAPPAQPRVRAAPLPRPAASSAEELRRERELARERARQWREEQLLAEREREREREQEQAQAQAQAEPAQEAASAPAEAASQASAEQPALDHWPADTRLSYQLSGHFRGPLQGDARVQWQREGAKYQVRLDVRIPLFGTQVLTSQGEVTPEGLLPRAYEELRPGKRRTTKIGDQVVTLDNGRVLPRPAGVQDTASQFVELSQRFATGKDPLEVGRSVSIWLARPGGLDEWTYDIVGREMLKTSMGEVECFHLKPRAIPIAKARGNITAEMWIAPSLQYLPVRIKVVMGEEAWVDLVVDRIEQ